jgi:hypothetical protein
VTKSRDERRGYRLIGRRFINNKELIEQRCDKVWPKSTIERELGMTKEYCSRCTAGRGTTTHLDGTAQHRPVALRK